jgi:hypothetical protein
MSEHAVESGVRYLGHPERLTAADESMHPLPQAEGLWGDTLWLDCIDTSAGITGVSHFHLTNSGFGRFSAHFWIDGVQQCWGRRVPFEHDPSITTWSDGALTYEIVEPFKQIRLVMDNPKYGFDLTYEGLCPVFEYGDCAHGNPLDLFGPISAGYGGHYQQRLRCTGTFQIRQGPAAGQAREIDTIAHRDHTWSDRFAAETPWELPETATPLHFWTAIELPERNINAVGFFDLAALGLEEKFKAVGGFEASETGNRVVLDATPIPEYDGDGENLRRNGPEGFRIELDGGEVITVRKSKLHAVASLWMRGDNDLENRFDCLEQLVDLKVEETGECGHGVLEHGVLPPSMRWHT